MQFEKKKKKTLLLKYCCRFDIFIYPSLICKLTVLHLHTLNKSQSKDDFTLFFCFKFNNNIHQEIAQVLIFERAKMS